MPDNPISHVMAGAAQFRTTRWSMVMRAGAEQLSEADERRALEELCRAYWYPVYSFVRRRGVDAHEAQDLTQAFFEKLIARNAFAVADQERGRFRTFLLAALNNFLFTERERAHRQKRGGGCEFISLDAEQAENRFQHEPATKESADRVFARRWIETLLVCVLERLAAEARDAGQGERFEQLKCYLVDDGGAMSFAALAAQLGTTEAAAKGVVRRMRARYRELVHEEVAHTVGSPDQIDEEIRHLMAAFG